MFCYSWKSTTPSFIIITYSFWWHGKYHAFIWECESAYVCVNHNNSYFQRSYWGSDAQVLEPCYLQVLMHPGVVLGLPGLALLPHLNVACWVLGSTCPGRCSSLGRAAYWASGMLQAVSIGVVSVLLGISLWSWLLTSLLLPPFRS